jgi:acetyl esterase
MGVRESSSPPSGTDSDPLDPTIRRFVDEVGAAWSRFGFHGGLSPVEARRIAEEVRAPWRRGGPPMQSIVETNAPVRMRFYDPGGAKCALVYVHGGGWTLFSLDTHDRIMREYASRAGVVVVGVDYSLSPEAKYPVALNEVVSAVRHVAGQYDRVAIGGDSAGANLALAAAIRLRAENLIRAIVLNYGVFARHSSREAIRRFGGPGNMLTADEMENFWRNYLRDERDAEDPLVCPVRADLRGLPPAFLAVPECDLLAEQSVGLSGRMRAVGVDVRMEIYRGAAHSFLEAVSISPLAERALDETAAWLRTTIG